MSNQEGHTALYKASYHGQRGVVETLVKAKAEVDGLNKVRNTLLDVHVPLVIINLCVVSLHYFTCNSLRWKVIYTKLSVCYQYLRLRNRFYI